ncbi:MAG: CinA family protein [Eubacteriales bacterium]
MSEREKVDLAESVVSLLKENKLTIATAESCTGGMLGARLIDVPGVSEVFIVGHITYANEAKMEVLGVLEESLLQYGAVSTVVAKEMVEGLIQSSHGKVGISITGIAGPGGGTAEKPVGTVFMGCHVCGKTTVKGYLFTGNRATIREKAVQEALILLQQCILESIAANQI